MALVPPGKPQEWKVLVHSLLSLPGEVRNRIYDYCTEPRPVAVPAPTHQYAPSCPCFGGLRYTCKTVYIEFTPIYLDRTIVSIQPPHVERYLAAVYPDRNVQADTLLTPLLPNVHGNIRINTRTCEALDITFIAELFLRAPKMHIELAQRLPINSMVANANDLLKALKDAPNLLELEKTVERVLFRYSLRSEVVIRLCKDVSVENLSKDVSYWSPRQWLIQQGFPALDHLIIVLESSKGVLRDPPIGASWPERQTSRNTMQGVISLKYWQSVGIFAGNPGCFALSICCLLNTIAFY